MFPPRDPREIDYLLERASCGIIAGEIGKFQKEKDYEIPLFILKDTIKLTKEISDTLEESTVNLRTLKLYYWVFGESFLDNKPSEKLRVKNVLKCLEGLSEGKKPFNGLLDYTRKYFDEMSARQLLPEKGVY